MPQNPLTDRSIFLAAIDIASPFERDAYLARVCGDDAPLRAEVQALLAAHAQSGDLLDAPDQVSPTIDQAPLEKSGTQIGPYKLLQQIGEGGMGVVYMAEQHEPVKRRVALKIIKPGMDTRQVIARFEAERQALSLMDHPNIAKVLDAGTTDSGRPYFVMELVKGQPITQYCDEKYLTPRQRLELLLPVCQAIQHAHQKGIIHRDIKPTNILVADYDQQPVPKVIDFGVAKATGQTLTEKTMFTGLGQIVGTLEYMSPEQAKVNQLDIDTRSDIYSLGVLLYELLTGSTPFDRQRLRSAAFDEMLRIIREEEPPKPSTRLSDSHDSLPSISAQRHTEPAKLTKLVRGELDWIVMKALEKDRNRRYETANGFAADVQRYLADEPVQACPPSTGYRFWKFVRRNKRRLATGALLGVMLLAVVGVLGWAVRDRAAREQEAARERETRQAVIKERVELALEEARNRHQEGRWKEALDAAKRAEALAATDDSDNETRRRAKEILGDMQMLARLEEVRVRSTQNQAGFDLKEEDSGNARAFREYGIDIDALDRDEAAMRIRTRSICYELAVLLDSWSYVRRRLAKQNGKDWKELLEVARAADPHPWRDRFRRAVLNDDRKTLVEVAASAPISSLSAETVDRLGDALMNLGAIKEATTFLKKGQRHHPQDYWINHNLGRCLLLLDPPQIEEAIRYFTAAVSLRPEAAQSRSGLTHALADQGRLDESAAFRPVLSPGPALVKPAAGAILESGIPGGSTLRVWEFDWVEVPGATKYHLYVIGPTAMGPAIDNSTLSSSSYRYESDGYASDWLGWRWKVRAQVNGIWSDWSEERTFDLAALDNKKLPPGPTLVKPAAGATLDNGTLDGNTLRDWEFGWSEVPGATRYHLFVIVATAKGPLINTQTLASSSFRYEHKGYIADQYRLGWRWKVRAQVNDVWSDWSEERTFDVAPVEESKPISPKK